MSVANCLHEPNNSQSKKLTGMLTSSPKRLAQASLWKNHNSSGIIAFKNLNSPHRHPSPSPHVHMFPKYPPLQRETSSPQAPAAAPSKVPATFLPIAPDCGAAVLLALGARVLDDDDVDEELDGVGNGDVEEEEAGAELEVARVVADAEVEIEVEVEVTVREAGEDKDDVSVKIAVGTEAVDTKPSVEAKIVPLGTDDALAPGLETAAEAVAMEL